MLVLLLYFYREFWSLKDRTCVFCFIYCTRSLLFVFLIGCATDVAGEPIDSRRAGNGKTTAIYYEGKY